jgi:hypothetical protein
MGDFFNVNTEANRLKQFFRHLDRVVECLRSDYRSRRFIPDAEEQVSPTFIRNRHAILVERAIVELCLGFLELQSLMFGRHLSPHIDLLWGRGHGPGSLRCDDRSLILRR